MHAPVSRSARRGGALILALLFIGGIAATFATWAIFIQQRARVSDLDEHQARKRLAAANSEMMARDYMLTRVLAADGDDTLNGGAPGTNGAAWTTDTAAIWKGSTQINDTWSVTNGWRGYALNSISWTGGINGFSPSYIYPYSKSLTFNVNYKLLDFVSQAQRFSNDTTTFLAHVRSSSPILSGDLLVLHKPNPTVAGNVAVQGRVVHFAPDLAASAYTARSRRFTSPGQTTLNVVPANLAGSPLLVSNLPWTALSCGNINNPNIGVDPNPSISTDWRMPDFTGLLNVIDAPTNASNSLSTELTANASTINVPAETTTGDSRGLSLAYTSTTGVATITPCLGSATTDLPGVVISNGLTEMVIDGQTGSNLTAYAPFRPVLAVVYTQDATTTGRNLTTIRLRNQNRRPMILALKKATRSPAIDHTVNIIVESPIVDPTWRLILLAENVPVRITYATSASPLYQATAVSMIGGIETDSPLIFPNSPQLFEINLEPDTWGLLRLTPRLAWAETFLKLEGKL